MAINDKYFGLPSSQNSPSGSSLLSPSLGQIDGNLTNVLTGRQFAYQSVMGAGGSFSDGQFVPNPLNRYDQVAYHFRLLCRGDKQGGGREIVIAESGVTGINIREVTIESLVAPNHDTMNTQTTTFHLTIVEPVGTSFLDGMFAAAQAAGVRNWQKSPYYLQLNFLGYEENGRIINPISDGLPNGGRWEWMINVSKVDVSLDTSGAVYNVTGIMFHDTALYDEWLSLSDAVHIKADTVEEFFQKLAEQMNKRVQSNYKTDLVTFAFDFPQTPEGPSAGKFRLLDPNSAEKDSYQSRSMVEEERDKFGANPTIGAKINHLVTHVIGATKEGQSLAIHGKEGMDPNQLPKGGFRDTVFYRAIPEVRIGDYVDDFGSYKRQIIYHVVPYRTQATTINSKETSGETSQMALDAILPRTRKRYEYIYTGQNTEVIDFRANFSFDWQATLPRLHGWMHSDENVRHHARYDREGVEKYQAYKQEQVAGMNAARMAVPASAVSSSSQYAESILEAADKDGMYNVISIAQTADSSRNAYGTGLMGQRGSIGRSVYGAMLDQIFSPTTFNQIDLVVRGDPFWLGGRYEDFFAPQQGDGSAPQFGIGDTCFVLSFKMPYGFDGNSGTPTFRNQDVYNGIYRATKITHSFSEGRFQQTITAQRLAKPYPREVATLIPDLVGRAYA
jgi:hypothetical protein